MAQEAKRGCGYRKVGGLYLVSGKLNAPCGGLPFRLCVCPTCGGGIAQSRGAKFIEPRALFGVKRCSAGHCGACPVSNPPEGKHLLIWIGEKHYPTPETFTFEASHLGVSRRIKSVPRGFKLGETWVYLAHPKAAKLDDGKPCAGIFSAFLPTKIEIIITQSQADDPEFMGSIERRGLTPVILDETDKDHKADKRKSKKFDNLTRWYDEHATANEQIDGMLDPDA